MAINIKELKAGNIYLEDNELYQCISNEQNKQGRLSGKYMVKRKNVRTGSITEISYNPTGKVEIAEVEKRSMTYSYNDGSLYAFMDTETYEIIEIPNELLEWEKNFLVEGNIVQVTTYEGEVLGVTLPASVDLEVREAEAAVKGDTATGATKNAILVTGLQIKCPLFIETGEIVSVNTTDGKYLGRAVKGKF